MSASVNPRSDAKHFCKCGQKTKYFCKWYGDNYVFCLKNDTKSRGLKHDKTFTNEAESI